MSAQCLWAALILSVPLLSADFTVTPGQSIQAAVDGAVAGDRILVQPGTYHEAGRACPTEPDVRCAVVISTDSISLIANPLPGQPVILENAGAQDTGIAVAKVGAVVEQCDSDPKQRVNGSHIEGFLVRNFDGRGIYLGCVDNWTVKANTAADNGEYGLFPLHCGHGRLTENIASGSHDTGIYIGLSNGARVDNNLAHDNVAGFEIENSTNIEMDHNTAIYNTGGILVFLFPGLDILLNRGNHVHHNFVYDNNRANACLNPSDEVCAVPPGTGILVLGGDHNQVDNNKVVANQSFGIALTDLCTATALPASVCRSAAFVVIPQFTTIISNMTIGNGGDTKVPNQPGADLIWSQNGVGNCWLRNQAILVSPPLFPPCER